MTFSLKTTLLLNRHLVLFYHYHPLQISSSKPQMLMSFSLKTTRLVQYNCKRLRWKWDLPVSFHPVPCYNIEILYDKRTIEATAIVEWDAANVVGIFLRNIGKNIGRGNTLVKVLLRSQRLQLMICTKVSKVSKEMTNYDLLVLKFLMTAWFLKF